MPSNKKNSKTTPRPAEAPRRLSGPVRFETLIAVVVMVLATCVLYPELVFQDKIFFHGDSQAAASFGNVGDKVLERGSYPLWNPYLFSGMPSFGSASYTPYIYPVSQIVGLARKVGNPPYMLWFLFHSFMTGLTMFWLMRDRDIHYAPAMCAGVLLIWMPNLVAVGAYGHGSQANAVAYIPIALMLWDRMWRGKGLLVNGAGLALVLGLSMLRGHLQISYYTYMIIGLHLAFFGIGAFIDASKGVLPKDSILPSRLRRRFGKDRYTTATAGAEFSFGVVTLATVVAWSLLICAVYYIPVHDYAQYSIRGASASGGADYDFATGWSLHPAETLSFVFPFAFGFGKDLYFGYMPFTDYPNYLGVVVLLLAFVALIKVRTRYVMYLGFLALVTTIIAFGKHFPILYDLMFKFAPFFDKFRVPVMIVIVQQVAMLALFAIGLDHLMRWSNLRGRKLAVYGLTGAFVVFMIVTLSQRFWSGDFAESIASRIKASTAQQQLMVARVAGTYLRNDLVRFAIVLAAAFVMLFAYFSNRRIPSNALAIGLLVLGMVDFHLINRHILHPEEFRQFEGYRVIFDRDVHAEYQKPDDVTDFLSSQPGHFRVYPLDLPQAQGLTSSNRYMMFEISSIGGYHAAKLGDYDELMRVADPRRTGNFDVVDMLNVKYLLTGAPLPDQPRFSEVWRGTNMEDQPRFIYENAQFLPRVRLLANYRVADKEATLQALASGAVNVREEVILEKAPGIEPAGASGQASITSYDFNEIHVSVDTPEATLLLLSEVYYPDWELTVNGSPGEIIRANQILRAVALPAGQHKLIFKYNADLLKKSAMISGGSMGVTVLILLGFLGISVRKKTWKR